MKRTTVRSVRGVLALVALVAVGCGPPDTFDRKQMLRDTVDQSILPTHEALGTEAAELESATTSFCEGDRTAEQLETLREEWKQLQTPLKHIQAWSFNMSPYRGRSFEVLVYKVDREPALAENVEEILDGDQTIDESFVASQDYTRSTTGFPTVEYLLFGSPDGTETRALYGSEGDHPDRRCDYLVASAKHARGVLDAYVEAWDPAGGNFAEDFQSTGSESGNWPTIQDSVNAMVSQMVFVTKQRISKNLFGGPLGQHESDDTVPNEVSSPYANYSLTQIEETFAGMQKLYAGPEGRSLADFAKFRKRAVHDDVVAQMEEFESALAEIPEPLADAVENNPEAVETAQAEIDELTSIIEADLKTTLGASTTRVVVDND